MKDQKKILELEKAGVITMSDHIVSSGVSLNTKVNVLKASNSSMTSLIIFAIKLWLLLKERVRSFIKCFNNVYEN